jgi:hypothetical protein
VAKAAALKKDKREWIWLQSMVDKDKWSLDHIPENDIHAPYIKRMSKNSDGTYTYYVYRNQKCLGAIRGKDQDKCLTECRVRAKLGKMPQELIDANKRVLEYVDSKERDVNVFKKFTEDERATIANVYPWAVPKKTDLDAKKIKTKTTRTDLQTKGEKKAEAMAAELPMDSKISRERDGNPKKEGTDPWKRWQFMFSYADNGKTVGEYVKEGGNPTTLKNGVKMGWVKVKGMT